MAANRPGADRQLSDQRARKAERLQLDRERSRTASCIEGYLIDIPVFLVVWEPTLSRQAPINY
jgi:hypothetical protein